MKKGVILSFAAAAVIAFSGSASAVSAVSFSDLKQALLTGGTYRSSLDTNGNGKLDIFDLCREKSKIVSPEKWSGSSPGTNDPDLNEESIYNAMIALKSEYPEGMRWTNDNYYGWKGGIFSGGYGCAGFAFMLSDAAFGSLPARRYYQYSVSDIRVGDILRVNNDSHSVIVLQKVNGGVVVAEGNYNSSIHWGRKFSDNDLKRLTYIMTRYPE